MRLRNVVKQALKFFKVSHTLKVPIPYLLWSFVLKLKLNSNHHAGNNKRLVKYCLYAWLAPALVVSMTVLIDRRLNKGYFGYGK